MTSLKILDHMNVDGEAETPVPATIKDYMSEERAWWKVSHLRLLSWAVFLITLSSTNNGYDSSMLNGLQSLSSWQRAMDHPRGQTLGALSNASMLWKYRRDSLCTLYQ